MPAIAEIIAGMARSYEQNNIDASKIAGKESRPTSPESCKIYCRSCFLRDKDCGRYTMQRR